MNTQHATADRFDEVDALRLELAISKAQNANAMLQLVEQSLTMARKEAQKAEDDAKKLQADLVADYAITGGDKADLASRAIQRAPKPLPEPTPAEPASK